MTTRVFLQDDATGELDEIFSARDAAEALYEMESALADEGDVGQHTIWLVDEAASFAEGFHITVRAQGGGHDAVSSWFQSRPRSDFSA